MEYRNRFSMFMINYMERKLSLVDNIKNTVQVYKLELVIFKDHMIIKEYNLKGLVEMFAYKMSLKADVNEILEGQREFNEWFSNYLKTQLNIDIISNEVVSEFKKQFNATIVFENVPCEFCNLPSSYVELYQDQNGSAYILCPSCERDLSLDRDEDLILKILN